LLVIEGKGEPAPSLLFLSQPPIASALFHLGEVDAFFRMELSQMEKTGPG